MSDDQQRVIITISTSNLPSWWPYIDEIEFEGYVGEGVKSHKTYVTVAEHERFPFRYLVNSTRCMFVDGNGGIVAFIKDNKVTITLRDMDFDLALLKENMGIQQQLLKTHMMFYDPDTGHVK